MALHCANPYCECLAVKLYDEYVETLGPWAHETISCIILRAPSLHILDVSIFALRAVSKHHPEYMDLSMRINHFYSEVMVKYPGVMSLEFQTRRPSDWRQQLPEIISDCN